MIHPSVAVLEHNLATYRRTWRGSVFSSFVIPVLFLLAMGKSVGSYVDARSGLGVPYLDYIAPGVLASTALNVAMGESSWPIFSSFQWSRVFHAMRASPLRITDILTGTVTYIVLRVAVATAGFLIVMVAFGTAHSPLAVLALPAGTLVGLATTTPVLAYAAVVDSDGMFAVLFRLVMIPMTLFAGVFFPVTQLPPAVRVLAYVSPLWHGVELCRAATLGTPTAWGWPSHLGCLLVFSAVGFVLARRGFARKMTDQPW